MPMRPRAKKLPSFAPGFAPGSLGSQESLRAWMEIQTAPPTEQIKWLLAFLEEDLDALTPAASVDRGWRLRALKPGGSVLRAWRRHERYERRDNVVWIVDAPWSPMESQQLAELQREIKAGVAALLLDAADNSPKRVWTLPGTRSAKLRRSGRGFFEWTWEADESSAILLGVAELIYDCGDHIRACKQCAHPFLAVKRQEYCTPEHGQLARDQKKTKNGHKKGATR